VGPDPLYQNVWESFQSWALPSSTLWRPPTDVYETRDALIVMVELAGVSEDDIQVTLFNDLLVVEGERPQPPFTPVEMHSCHQLGIKYGMFRSEIHLPALVDQTGVRADYTAGILRIVLPKTE